MTKLELKQKELIDLISHLSLGLKDADFKKYQELESEISALEQELITDSDIEAWADTQERRLTSYHMGLQADAKALRDGEIKHIK
jgi:hypothetical protein